MKKIETKQLPENSLADLLGSDKASEISKKTIYLIFSPMAVLFVSVIFFRNFLSHYWTINDTNGYKDVFFIKYISTLKELSLHFDKYAMSEFHLYYILLYLQSIILTPIYVIVAIYFASNSIVRADVNLDLRKIGKFLFYFSVVIFVNFIYLSTENTSTTSVFGYLYYSGLIIIFDLLLFGFSIMTVHNIVFIIYSIIKYKIRKFGK